MRVGLLRIVTPIVLLTLLGIGGCAATAPDEAPPVELTRVWPDPPEPSRIRFLQTFSGPQDLEIKNRWWHKVIAFLVGSPTLNIVQPYGLAKDTQERIYVVDTFYRGVHVFDSRESDHYIFPTKPVPDFVNPIEVATGPAGRVFVSDSQSGLVHVFSEAGKRYESSFGRGELQRPTGLAVDVGSGELLVVDTLLSQLLVYGLDDLKLRRRIGRNGDDAESFHFPTHVAIAADGAIYVTDSLNFRVQRLNADKTFIGPFGSIGRVPGTFSRPKGLATDSEGHVYVVDALFDNVQVFDTAGQLLLAFGTSGNTIGDFWLPSGIYIDSRDRIYVSDTYNHRVQVFQYIRNEVAHP